MEVCSVAVTLLCACQGWRRHPPASASEQSRRATSCIYSVPMVTTACPPESCLKGLTAHVTAPLLLALMSIRPRLEAAWCVRCRVRST